ncbi:MAG: hypothetical protein ABL901_05340 [Hyphomicrobiaceae bacterium]
MQDKYFELMCATALNTAGCPTSIGDDWRRVVHVALNDIDDRCEVYVTSLRQAKRDSEGYVAELKQIAKSTNVILGLALDKTKGAKTIAIVQSAFGLGDQSISTYYSRLLLAVPPGTVQQLVLKRQTDFRVGLRDGVEVEVVKATTTEGVDSSKTVITATTKAAQQMRLRSKADAYYVIKSYLRICLPETIEASINEGLEDAVFLEARSKTPEQTRKNPDTEALTARARTR